MSGYEANKYVPFHFSDPETLEFPFYVFLKCHIYDRVMGMRTRPRKLSEPLAAARPASFSARQVQRMIERRGRKPERQFTDLFDMTSYFVRNRLQGLNHGTALLQTGRGVRNSVSYEWNQRIDESTLTSYERLHRTVDGRVNLGLDLFRILEAFGDAVFTRDDFLAIFRGHRDAFVRRRWYRIATPTQAKDTRFTNFLIRRLDDLRKTGLIDHVHGAYVISPNGDEAAHWFELFVYSVQY